MSVCLKCIIPSRCMLTFDDLQEAMTEEVHQHEVVHHELHVDLHLVGMEQPCWLSVDSVDER
jgi:hypothetical protein